MRVVLDTCILKLATFPGENNASALIFELAHTVAEMTVRGVKDVPLDDPDQQRLFERRDY